MPELQSGDKRVLTAATEIVRKGLANVTLLGDPEAVAQDADRLGLDLAGIKIVDHMVNPPPPPAAPQQLETGCTPC